MATTAGHSEAWHTVDAFPFEGSEHASGALRAQAAQDLSQAGGWSVEASVTYQPRSGGCETLQEIFQQQEPHAKLDRQVSRSLKGLRKLLFRDEPSSSQDHGVGPGQGFLSGSKPLSRDAAHSFFRNAGFG